VSRCRPGSFKGKTRLATGVHLSFFLSRRRPRGSQARLAEQLGEEVAALTEQYNARGAQLEELHRQVGHVPPPSPLPQRPGPSPRPSPRPSRCGPVYVPACLQRHPDPAPRLPGSHAAQLQEHDSELAAAAASLEALAEERSAVKSFHAEAASRAQVGAAAGWDGVHGMGGAAACVRGPAVLGGGRVSRERGWCRAAGVRAAQAMASEVVALEAQVRLQAAPWAGRRRG
jgi:hypothetical protein